MSLWEYKKIIVNLKIFQQKAIFIMGLAKRIFHYKHSQLSRNGGFSIISDKGVFYYGILLKENKILFLMFLIHFDDFICSQSKSLSNAFASIATVNFFSFAVCICGFFVLFIISGFYFPFRLYLKTKISLDRDFIVVVFGFFSFFANQLLKNVIQ